MPLSFLTDIYLTLKHAVVGQILKIPACGTSGYPATVHGQTSPFLWESTEQLPEGHLQVRLSEANIRSSAQI